MNPDALSDLLRAVRIRGAVFYHVNCHAPWSAESPPVREIAGVVLPGCEHVMEYHMLARGNGWAAVDGEPPVRLAAGDIVLFPHGDRHVISSAPGVAPLRREADWVFATRDTPKPMPVAFHHGVVEVGSLPDAEIDTELMCGFLGCDAKPFNPLLAALPRLLHLPSLQAGDWASRAIGLAVDESNTPRPGGSAVLERLAEMMFVDAARRHLDSLSDDATGWLAGLRDRYVGRALALLHARPEHAWSVDELAHAVGLSRSALHERFEKFLGDTPMRYLANWRIQLGARLLRDTRQPVAAIALEVGYDSEAAFSRAFKRITGLPPAAWRKAQTRV